MITLNEFKWLKELGYKGPKDLDSVVVTLQFKKRVLRWIDIGFPDPIDDPDDCFSYGYNAKDKRCKSCEISEECKVSSDIHIQQNVDKMKKLINAQQVKIQPTVVNKVEQTLQQSENKFVNEVMMIVKVEQKISGVYKVETTPTLWCDKLGENVVFSGSAKLLQYLTKLGIQFVQHKDGSVRSSVEFSKFIEVVKFIKGD